MISNRVEGKGKGKGLLNRAPQLRWWSGISFIQTPSQDICYLFHPIRRILYTCIVGINKTSNCFSRQSYWKKKWFYLPSYMPTRVKGFGFCFSCHKWRHHQRKQVVSSALGFSSFYLTNKASWTWVLGGWKVPIKRHSQRYRTGAGLYRFYHSVPAEAYQLLQREVQEALQKAIMK